MEATYTDRVFVVFIGPSKANNWTVPQIMHPTGLFNNATPILDYNLWYLKLSSPTGTKNG